MKLYTSPGVNPWVVDMFVAERGIVLERIAIDIVAGENKEPAHLARNPNGTTPVLELDDGTFLSETTPICEYLDDMTPGETLIGADPLERAECRMWTRRVDLYIAEPLTHGFRFGAGADLFKGNLPALPAAAERMNLIARQRAAWLDSLMEPGKFLCGERFTLADVVLFCFLTFANWTGQPLDAGNGNLADWMERVSKRPSAAVVTV